MGWSARTVSACASIAHALALFLASGSTPALAWNHTAWPVVPDCGAATILDDPRFSILTGVDPQDGWPTPTASGVPATAVPGIEAPLLPREILVTPAVTSWDRSAEVVHAASSERRLRRGSAGSPWLFVALAGAAGVAVLSVAAFSVAQPRIGH